MCNPYIQNRMNSSYSGFNFNTVCVWQFMPLISCVFPQPQHTNVCFWYLPPGIRYMEDKEERKKRLHKVGEQR